MSSSTADYYPAGSGITKCLIIIIILLKFLARYAYVTCTLKSSRIFFLAIMSKSPVHDNPKGSHIEMPNSPEGYNPVGS